MLIADRTVRNGDLRRLCYAEALDCRTTTAKVSQCTFVQLVGFSTLRGCRKRRSFTTRRTSMSSSTKVTAMKNGDRNQNAPTNRSTLSVTWNMANALTPNRESQADMKILLISSGCEAENSEIIDPMGRRAHDPSAGRRNVPAQEQIADRSKRQVNCRWQNFRQQNRTEGLKALEGTGGNCDQQELHGSHGRGEEESRLEWHPRACHPCYSDLFF